MKFWKISDDRSLNMKKLASRVTVGKKKSEAGIKHGMVDAPLFFAHSRTRSLNTVFFLVHRSELLQCPRFVSLTVVWTAHFRGLTRNTGNREILIAHSEFIDDGRCLNRFRKWLQVGWSWIMRRVIRAALYHVQISCHIIARWTVFSERSACNSSNVLKFSAIALFFIFNSPNLDTQLGFTIDIFGWSVK